jgi:hypothetical protein
MGDEVELPDGVVARGADSTAGAAGCTEWHQFEVFNTDSGLWDTVSICTHH